MEWVNHKIQGTYVKVRDEGVEVGEIMRNRLYMVLIFHFIGIENNKRMVF